MSLKPKNFQFGDFLLDSEERTLLHKHKPVAITPKTFLLLQTLVENHGRIVEKDQLMSAVWPDSFVEDGNLTFTINLLRKALEDDKQNPRFIKTIPKRGYRFISDVSEITKNEVLNNGSNRMPVGKLIEGPSIRKLLFPVLAIVLASAVALGFWYARSEGEGPQAAVLSEAFNVEKLSTNGVVHHAILSPDGKNVVYTNGTKGKQSIWLRQLESSTNVQIIPPSDHFYYGLAFSPDGNFLYFTRRPKLTEGQADIFRVSIFGGVPDKIVTASQGWISVSPDGEKISFVRCYYREDENCSLWIADALDGRNEKKLVSRPRPLRIGDVEFSPSGRSIAFAIGQSENQANEFGLAQVDIESGAESELTAEKFFNIKAIEWLPNQSGLLVTASRTPGKTYNIWQVLTSNGRALPLTNDSENYSALGLDKDARLLVSTQVKRDFNLRLYKTGDPAEKQIVADALSVNFAPSGSIVFSSVMTGNEEIWSVNGDGTGQKQLTSDAAEDTEPIVSPDNNSIFFSSNRTGVTHIWRMNSDGSNQAQLTKIEGGFPIYVSGDGKWVYYKEAVRKTLRRVSTVDGEEQEVLNKRSSNFALSPDGLYVALAEVKGERKILNLISLAEKRSVKSFDLADQDGKLTGLVWSHDGKFLAYTLANSEFENNRLWFQQLDREKPKQIAVLGDDEMSGTSSFALSRDGKNFAVIQGSWKHDAVLLRGLK